MHLRTWSVILCALLCAPLSSTARGEIRVQLEQIASGLARPVVITPAPGDDSRLFIVEQHTGQIKILNTANNSINATPFLDIDGLATGNEQGLLGLAFHPDYATNGKFYVNLTVSSGGATEIREYQRSANPNVAATTFNHVLGYSQPQSNHNGGWIGFNPKTTPTTEQYLYIASGDGGGGGDTGTGHTSGMGNAQDITDNLLGKMLRIDVNSDGFPADANRNYAIPASNPLVGVTGDDEIWAYGLRNPWRNSFDRTTGDLWIGDVGQNIREEVNFQPASSPGGENYGWRVMEGEGCFSASDPLPCNSPAFTPPIHQYNHDSSGGFSITGGYVYRGPIEALQGQYFFTDYVSDRIWAFKYENGVKSEFAEWTGRMTTNAGTFDNLSSFGEDNAGNLYLVSLDGEIHKMVSSTEIFRLVETGSTWKYLADGSNQGTAWRAREFDDSAWPSGASQLGYGDNDEATVIPCGPVAACNANNYITTYFRHEITEEFDPSLVASLTLEVLRDDAAAVYLNGEQVYRDTNLAANAAFNTPASSAIANADETVFASVSVNPAMLLADGNVLAVEIHQSSATSSDVSFDLRLTPVFRTPTPGDINFDGAVNAVDAAALAENFGMATGALWIDGDFNADGAVDLNDAAILQRHFGGPAASSSAVPEPSSMCVVLIGLVGVFASAWQRRAK